MNRTVRATFFAIVAITVTAPRAMALGFTDESQLPQKGEIGKAFRFQIKGRNGSPPYKFKIDSGNLPPGLSFSDKGLIVGRPTAAGEFKYWANLEDLSGRHSERHLTITVDPARDAQANARLEDWEKPGWKLTYFDEFEHPRLDESHWVAKFQGDPKMPANVAIHDGSLHVMIDRDAPAAQVQPLPRPEKPGRASSVETQRLFMQQYGLVEIRAPRKSQGATAVFWMSPVLEYEKTKADGGTRANGDEAMEIDAFAFRGEKAFDSAVHFGRGFGEGHDAERKRVELPFSPSDDFHVYALQWDEKSLVWFVDGKEMHRSGRAPHAPMFLRASVFGDEAGDFEVDYVRVYERE